MQQEVRILECSLKEGVVKASGKAYKFYVVKLYCVLGVVEAISNEELKADIDKKVQVVLSQNNGKFAVKRVI